MRKTILALCPLVFAGSLAAFGDEVTAAEQVLNVSELELCDCSTPVLVAEGETRTAGWENARLEVVEETAETVRLEFVAEPPAGMAAQVISEVRAALALPEAWREKNLLVVSEQGTKEICFTDDAFAAHDTAK